MANICINSANITGPRILLRELYNVVTSLREQRKHDCADIIEALGGPADSVDRRDEEDGIQWEGNDMLIMDVQSAWSRTDFWIELKKIRPELKIAYYAEESSSEYFVTNDNDICHGGGTYHVEESDCSDSYFEEYESQEELIRIFNDIFKEWLGGNPVTTIEQLDNRLLEMPDESPDFYYYPNEFEEEYEYLLF